MRRLDHRRGELGLEIFVVQRAGQPVRVVRKVIHFTEQVIPVAAEGVVDIRAPPTGNAALEFQNNRVITRNPRAHLMREYVPKLRERAQQLAARNYCLASERTERRIAKHWIGYQCEQTRPLRKE